MTDQEINIAIAEACGWAATVKNVPEWVCTNYDGSGEYRDKLVVIYVKDDAEKRAENLPRYTTDLNAMHDAEEVLTPEQKDLYYGYELERIGRTQGFYYIYSATAAQRAEAFLRTIGKWKQ